jgi:3-deoxy-7-phosphoheptulonate synthase
MIIVMKREATEKQIQTVVNKLVSQNFDVHRSTGVERTVLGAVGSQVVDPRDYESLDGVKEVIRLSKD